MGLDQYAHLRNRKIDWKKYYNDDEDEQKDVFVWRKHARLHQFMSDKFDQLNPDAKEPMNGYDELVLTEQILKELKQEIDNRYAGSFCQGGFFWGHQFQEESVREYKKQDIQFYKWALAQVKKGNTVIYNCSW